MSCMWNEERLLRFWEEAYDELIGNGMSKSEAEHAATDIALAKYEEQLKEILHVAGTKLFGEVVKTRKVDSLKLSSTGVMVANQTANNIYQS